MKKWIYTTALLLICLALCGATAWAEGSGEEALVLAEDDNLYLAVMSMEEVDGGMAIGLETENRSDKTLMFSLRTAVVNGFMADPGWSVELEPNERVESTLEWYDLSEYGVTSPASQVELWFNVYDSDDWLAASLLEEKYVLYPLGEEKARVDEREAVDGEIVLAEDENLRISVLSMEPQRDGLTIRLGVDNYTDKPLRFMEESVTVNGYVADPYWGVEVAPGMKANTTMSWYSLESYGITTPASLVDMWLSVSDADNILATPVLRGRYTLYPLGEEKAQIEKREAKEEDVVLAEEEWFSCVVTGCGMDWLGFTASVYLRNDSDQAVMFSVEDGTMNGHPLKPFWACVMPANSQEMSEMFWFDSGLKEYDIKDVEEITMTLAIYDASFSEKLFEEEVVLKP